VGNYAALLGDFWRNPNTRALTPEARSLYCDALSYCADNLTDGIVSKAMLQGMHGALPVALPIALLTAVRPDGGSFWIDLGDAIEVVGYLDANPSKAELRAKADKGRKAAQSRWKPDVGPVVNDGSNAKCNASGNAECIPNPEPRTQNPELLTQNIYTRAREEPAQATPAQIDRAVADALSEVRAAHGPAPVTEAQRRIDAITHFELVERMFAIMRKRCTKSTWRRSHVDYQPIQSVAEWVQHVADTEGVEPKEALGESLTGFSRDPWAKTAGFPLSAWARDPGKYRDRAIAGAEEVA
jgi:hypothetical protein